MGKYTGVVCWIGVSVCLIPCEVHADESLKDYEARAVLIEKQVDVCCRVSATELDPVKSQIAERVLSPHGFTSDLSKAVKQSAEAAATVLESSEQVVVHQYARYLEQQKDLGEKKLNLALKQLKTSESNRAPASISDPLRNDVHDAYVKFRSVDQNFSASPEFKNAVNDLQNSKISELNALASISERITAARKKASIAYCRNSSNDDCKSEETLKSETDYYNASNSHHTASNRVFNIGLSAIPASATSFAH